MAAPFELPDVCDIMNFYPGGTISAADVPCRQVPCYATGTEPDIYETEVRRGYSHWVDFEPDVFVYDNASLYAGDTAINIPSVRATLVFTMADVLLVLKVNWVEDRFTNTDKAYTRAYCLRQLRQI